MKIDLSSIAAPDIEYNNVPLGNGETGTLILTSQIPLRYLFDTTNQSGLLYSKDNKDFVKKILYIKTDPKIVDRALDFISPIQWKRINGDIQKLITAITDNSEDIEKKKFS